MADTPELVKTFPDQIERLTTELAQAQQQLDLAFTQRDQYLAELQKTRAVVKAAMAWAKHPAVGYDNTRELLATAVAALDNTAAADAAPDQEEP